MNEFLSQVTVPSLTLQGQDEADYIDTLQTVFRRSRLNAYYPDARHLAQHVSILAPQCHRGIYPGVQVDSRTGLPTYREWTRAQTDTRVAPDQLRQLNRAELAEKAARDPDSVHGRQLAKHDYYREIVDTSLVPLGDMTVRLRRIEPHTSTAHFNVVLDKLDASGVFVRYTIDVAQKRDAVERIANVDEREVARQTEDFQGLIYRFTSLDAEFTFVKLETMGALKVERVVKGVVGPIYFDFTRNPDEVHAFVKEHGFLATFGLDMAAIDVTEDKNNDPWADRFKSNLNAESRRGYDAARKHLNYKVFKDRKFVCPRRAVPAVHELCSKFGTRNVVYGV